MTMTSKTDQTRMARMRTSPTSIVPMVLLLRLLLAVVLAGPLVDLVAIVVPVHGAGVADVVQVRAAAATRVAEETVLRRAKAAR
jgi:hypothetical protein